MSSEIQKINMNLQINIWNGTIPVEITLDPADLTDFAAPAPLYLQVPRTSLWSHVLSSVFSHFGPHTTPLFTAGLSTTTSVYDLEDSASTEIAELPSSCWLETSDGRAINWTVPVGVTADILISKPDSTEAHVAPIYSSTQPTSRLPLRLVAHFSKYPAFLPPYTLPILPPSLSSATPQAVYTHVHIPSSSHRMHMLSAVKQASSILYGSANAAFSLPISNANVFVLYPYHPVSCALSYAQKTIHTTAHLPVPVTALGKNVSQWKDSLLALDSEAYRVWRASKYRLLEDLEAEVLREEKRKEEQEKKQEKKEQERAHALNDTDNGAQVERKRSSVEKEVDEKERKEGEETVRVEEQEGEQSKREDGCGDGNVKENKDSENTGGNPEDSKNSGKVGNVPESASADSISSSTVASENISSNPENAESSTNSLESMQNHIMELRSVLHLEYTSAVDVIGPHMLYIPIRVYTSIEYLVKEKSNGRSNGLGNVSAETHAIDIARPRTLRGQKQHTIIEFAQEIFKNDIVYGVDLVFMAHGIELDGNMPLNWAYSHFRNPDLWLHLIIVRKTNKLH